MSHATHARAVCSAACPGAQSPVPAQPNTHAHVVVQMPILPSLNDVSQSVRVRPSVRVRTAEIGWRRRGGLAGAARSPDHVDAAGRSADETCDARAAIPGTNEVFIHSRPPVTISAGSGSFSIISKNNKCSAGSTPSRVPDLKKGVPHPLLFDAHDDPLNI